MINGTAGMGQGVASRPIYVKCGGDLSRNAGDTE